MIFQLKQRINKRRYRRALSQYEQRSKKKHHDKQRQEPESLPYTKKLPELA
jgi:hypothetical protein